MRYSGRLEEGQVLLEYTLSVIYCFSIKSSLMVYFQGVRQSNLPR